MARFSPRHLGSEGCWQILCGDGSAGLHHNQTLELNRDLLSSIRNLPITGSLENAYTMARRNDYSADPSGLRHARVSALPARNSERLGA